MNQPEFSHLIESIGALSPDQMRQLRRELEDKLAVHAAGDRPLTPDQQADLERQRRLFDAGLLSEIKPPRRVTTGTERFAPIRIEGEPLSETVIRGRR